MENRAYYELRGYNEKVVMISENNDGNIIQVDRKKFMKLVYSNEIYLTNVMYVKAINVGKDSYQFVDLHNNIRTGRDVNKEKLKQIILSLNVIIMNMKLTSDNRLIQTDWFKNNKDTYGVPDIVNRAKALGLRVEEFYDTDNNVIYTILNGDTATVVLTKGVRKFEVSYMSRKFQPYTNVREYKIIGGESLTELKGTFRKINCDTIDMSGLKPQNIEIINRLLLKCNVNTLIIGGKFNKLKEIHYMFKDSTVKNLITTDVSMPNLTDISKAFAEATVENMNFEFLSDSKLKLMYRTFERFKTQSIDLNCLDLSQVINTEYAFNDCKAETVKIGDKNRYV